MIRLVIAVEPNLYALSTAEEHELLPQFRINGKVYVVEYSSSDPEYVLYSQPAPKSTPVQQPEIA